MTKKMFWLSKEKSALGVGEKDGVKSIIISIKITVLEVNLNQWLVNATGRKWGGNQ